MPALLFSPLFASMADKQILYVIPAMIAVSLVYGASRDERAKEIFRHAWGTLVWLSGFLIVIIAIVWLISWAAS